MNVLIILFDAIAYSTGLLNLFLAVLLYVRDRDALYIREFLLMLGFSAIVITQSLMTANGGTLPLWFTPGGSILANCGVAILIYALPWYVHHLEPVKHLELKNRLFLMAAILVLVANISASMLPASGAANVKDTISTIGLAACVGTTVYTILLGVIAKIIHGLATRKLPPEEQKPINETTRTAIRMGIFTLIFLPAMIYLDFADLPIQGMPSLKGIHIVPMIYILWSILLMNLRIRTLLAPMPGPVSYTTEGIGRFSDEFLLSPREREVMDQLIQGRTYDQIADKLCISLSTAKTHIGRIYRKAKVTNKVELIHSLQKSAQKTAPDHQA